MKDLVYIWYDDRYWSKVFIISIRCGLEVKVMDFHVKVFAFKFLKIAYLSSLIIGLVYIWYNDSYWSKVFISNIRTTACDLEVKVTD